MSGRIVAEVMDYAPEDLRDSEFLVLLALAESARDHNRTSRTNTKEIARRSRRSEGTVRNAIMGLTRRCLIYPVHNQASLGSRKRIAQDYRIVQLESHHRAATMRFGVTSRDDTKDEPKSEVGVTPRSDSNRLWITPGDDKLVSLPGEFGVTSRDDTHRKDSPVTTVSSNSSRQVTVDSEPREGSPSPLRSEALEEQPPAATPVARGHPPPARQPDRRASHRRPKRKR